MKQYFDTGLGGEGSISDSNLSTNIDIEETVIEETLEKEVPRKVENKPKKKKKIKVNGEEPKASKIDLRIKELKKLSRKIEMLKEVKNYANSLKKDSEFPIINSEVGDLIEVVVSQIINKLENSIN